MRKFRTISLLAVLTVVLALVSQAYASPASQGNAKNTPGANATAKATERAGKLTGKPEHFKGTITNVAADSLTLDVSGTSVTVGLTTDTRIHIPGGGQLQAGQNAMVLARRDGSNNLVASGVQVIPGKPALAHRVGIVTAYTPGASLTIQAHDGNSYTFGLTADTKILPADMVGQLAVGSLVTVIAPRDPSGGTLMAAGIVVHPVGSGSGAFASPTPAP